MNDFSQILEMLNQSEFVTREQISKKLHVSKRKVQILIDDLNYMLKNSAKIESKTGSGNGYSLVIFNMESYKKCRLKLDEENINKDLFILKELLLNSEYCKGEELADKLFVSQRSLRQNIQTVKEILGKYRLNLMSKPHYGMKVIGDEKNIRYCLVNEVIKKTKSLKLLSSIIPDYEENFKSIKIGLERIFIQEEYKIHDFVLDNLVIHILIAVERIRNGSVICGTKNQIQDNQINHILQVINIFLEESFNIELNEQESDNLAVHLITKRDYSSLENRNVQDNICEFVLEMLMQIDMVYHTKLHLDFDLCMDMSLHFIPLLFRIEHHMNLENPIIDEIKQNYIYEYELACIGAEVINNRYNCKLSDDEIGYLALDIRLSLSDRRCKKKNNVLIICSTGRGSSEIMKINFRRNFGSFIDVLDTTPLNELSKYDLNKYDYIFTTIPFDNYSKTPCFYISSFLHESDLSKINKIFSNQDHIADYFDEDLFIKDLKVQNQEEVIHFMIEHVRKYYRLPDDFEDLVFKREQMASTAFGNNVAFPHPYQMTCDDTFVCIASLKKPVIWGKKKVRLVILAAIAKDEKKNIEDLYEALTKIINYQENVDKLIDDPSLETVYKILKNVSNNVADPFL